MNENIKTTGIIIGKRDFMEADKVLIVFTKDLGKIQVKAKGLRKMTAKMAGHLEMFNHVELELIKGRSFYIVIGAQILESFNSIKTDLDRTGVFYYFCEILDKILEEGVSHKNTFKFLMDLLEKLKTPEEDALLLTLFFEINVLAYLGFKPEFMVCVGCREDISGHKFYFSSEKGGVLCETCSEKDFFVNNISPNSIKLMRIVLSNQYDILKSIKMDRSVPLEIKSMNKYFIEHILGRELKSAGFINGLK